MSIPTNRTRLLKIWRQFFDYKRPYLEQTTIDQIYNKVTLRLEQMPYWIDSGQDVVEWMAEVKRDKDPTKPKWSHETQRRTLQKLKSATAWAKKSGLIRRDPFECIDNLPDRTQNTDKYRAFSPGERTAILGAAKFLETHQRQWVQALFYTGCRPSELRALKRHHWSQDGSQLRIISGFPYGAVAPKATKNRKTTPDYPCNSQLQALLRELTEGIGEEDFLFKEPDGSPFNYHGFQTQIFKPLMQRLAKEGKIAWPMSQYHARHTWITEALKTLAIADVAYLARTSPEIIMKHYAGKSRHLSIPEI